jgi:hypothetical protein
LFAAKHAQIVISPLASGGTNGLREAPLQRVFTVISAIFRVFSDLFGEPL